MPERVVRKIPSDGPSKDSRCPEQSFCWIELLTLFHILLLVTDNQDPNLACNTGGETGAGLVASVPAGSKVKFEWTNVCGYTFVVDMYSNIFDLIRCLLLT